jgi:DNA helicase II / ATP-dependent DNA helicase PcrA
VLASTAASYLETLNPEQRRAVEHGVSADGRVGTPLLVIAGAGSGKTNTLAHRVAHLIVSDADPRRILLMTFSRRAASEMSRRVERIARKVLGSDAGIMTDALSWAGTFQHWLPARRRRRGSKRQAHRQDPRTRAAKLFHLGPHHPARRAKAARGAGGS